jgi:spore maturation protein SpmB
MSFLIDAIMPAGRAAVELSLFVLLPVMVVMLSVMRLLEASGRLDQLVGLLAPLLRPFGLPGLGVFAAIQINFVSFAAPVATLAMMEKRGASDRHIAAVLAMVLAMAQANAALPMLSMGLDFGPTLALSAAGGLIASAAAYYVFARRLSDEEHMTDDMPHHAAAADGPKGFFDVVNRAGAEAFKIAVGAMPMLVVSLAAVSLLRAAGAVDGLAWVLRPALDFLQLDSAMVLPAVTKYLAGGTAMMGVVDGMVRAGEIDARLLNAAAGFLIQPLDVPGVAVLIAAGPRVAKVWKPAALAAVVGVAARVVGHSLLY